MRERRCCRDCCYRPRFVTLPLKLLSLLIRRPAARRRLAATLAELEALAVLLVIAPRPR